MSEYCGVYAKCSEHGLETESYFFIECSVVMLLVLSGSTLVIAEVN